MNTYIKERRDEGFTLIELLIAIVVVGVLTAVVIVGIGGLTDNGKKGACQASYDAAKAGEAVYFANHSSTYPSSFKAMLTDAPKPELELDQGVTTPDDNTISGNGCSVAIANDGTGKLTPTGC